MTTYKIVRMFKESSNRTVKTGLTKEEAMRHCQDPETSSSTCTTWIGKDRTKKRGAWFDAWTDEQKKGLRNTIKGEKHDRDSKRTQV